MMRRAPMKRTAWPAREPLKKTEPKEHLALTQQAPLAIKYVAKMTTKRKPTTPAKEKRYLDRVAQLDCVVCGAHGVHIHHAREGEGMGQRAQNWLAIAVCPSCHTGPRGIHWDKSVLRQEKLDEMDLLARTIERLNS